MQGIRLFSAILFFEEVCEMENIRCFDVIHKLKEIAEVSYFYLEDIIENNESCEIIKQQGFKMFFKTNYCIEEIREFLMYTVFLSKVNIEQLDNENEFSKNLKKKDEDTAEVIIIM